MFLVDVGQNFQNGTNFTLTLSVSGLTTSVTFPVIVQGECVCVFVCVCVWVWSLVAEWFALWALINNRKFEF